VEDRDGPVLVTGGTGFIGSYVTGALLERGREVVALDLKPFGAEARFLLGEAADRVPVELVSIENWPRVIEVVERRRPSAIVHLATITNPVFLKTNPLPGLRVMTEGTLTILEAARIFGVRRVVYASSIGVLPARQYEPIDADHPIVLAREGPGSGVYGAAKAASECFCFAYNVGFGLDVRIVRPSAVYGLGMQWPIYIKPMVESAVRGEPVSFGSGGPFPRDYTHAADVAGLVCAVLDGPDGADRVFYAATGEPLVTARELAELVMELVPGASIEIADTLSEDDHLELRYRGRLSIENARTQLGWSPRFARLRDGVAEYAERYRAFLEASR
jgi:nucleoside-diphosphate-sugar epimerase